MERVKPGKNFVASTDVSQFSRTNSFGVIDRYEYGSFIEFGRCISS